DFFFQHINIPYDNGSRIEVISNLFRDPVFRPLAVIPLAPHFGGKDRSAVDELSACWRAYVKGSVRAERISIWKIDDEPDIIRDRVATARLLFVIVKASEDAATGAAGQK